MKVKVLVFVVLALALMAAPAMAKEGPYLGAGLTYVNITNAADQYFDTVNPAIGLELRVGYNFGSVALEGNFIGSTHEDDFPGFSDGDFRAASIDLRFSFTQQNDPTQVYGLVGVGAYSFEQTDTFFGDKYEFDGAGLNLGLGFEHFFNEQVALDVRGVYRFINYDLDVNGVQVANNLDGDTFTLGVALNFHF